MSFALTNQQPLGLLGGEKELQFLSGESLASLLWMSWLQGAGGGYVSSNLGMIAPSLPWLQAWFERCSCDLDKPNETRDI